MSKLHYSEQRIIQLENEAKEHEQNGTMTDELRLRYASAIAWHSDSIAFPWSIESIHMNPFLKLLS